MSGRFPKGADLLATIRKQGYRHSGPVFVFLDIDRPRPKIFSDMPLTAEICIRPAEDIDSLDFWPLADLDLTIHGGTALNDRLRDLLKAITKARPRFLMGGVPAEKLLFSWHPQRGWEYAHV
jgi:hypothetical protein